MLHQTKCLFSVDERRFHRGRDVRRPGAGT